ncbi:nucleotidyltransferase domain-containing protein [Meiothermus taiwanensis]|jgi:predicted nucleotidyltransferase|uniref:Nucleotidyltransferase domain protein n=1 Tax=Meiothermus taiwanensis TaxID=172827 RepID=A0A399DVM5_9DEIN|nr:nucleotidyltransferase domain-containing protein [Meiothermus taiwanensis]KIQ53876.1 DNA polymerase III subunit beta [Meiothermus taiwanensis]KZK15417.1 DNA polymerase III subunit beta [Meiothermus taiwanensis]RIH76234.1 Nucleotidyltransferase domain protein [Meiothermus taiwanensis]
MRSILASALARRAEEREALLQEARAYAQRVRNSLGEAEVYLYGSVARGDFNLESDIDLLVVSPNLPKDPLERARLLFSLRQGREEPKGLLPQEFAQLRARGGLWFLEEAVPL